MKKVIYFAVVASVAFASCTKNEVRTVEDNQDRQITFQAVVHKASTKSLINDTAYPKDGPSFGTFAYFYPNTFLTETKPYIDNAEVKNTTSATSGFAWTTNPVYYWPKQGKLTFYSYSPYSINGSNSTPNVTCNISDSGEQGIVIASWDVDAHQKVDVMIADRIDDQKSNSNNGGWDGVPTVFRHKLAQVVDFKLNTDKEYAIINVASGKHTAGSKQFFVNEIKLYQVKHEGKFVSEIQPGNGTDSGTSIGAWSDLSSVTYKDYTWFTQTTNSSTESASVAKNEFKYTASGESYNPFVCPKSGKSEEAGDHYNIKENGYLLVRPQTFTGGKLTESNNSTAPSTGAYIKFTYTIRTWWGNETESGEQPYSDETVTVYQTLAGIHGTPNPEWKINKRYTYEIKVSLDQIYWAPSVENWEDATAPSITF